MEYQYHYTIDRSEDDRSRFLREMFGLQMKMTLWREHLSLKPLHSELLSVPLVNNLVSQWLGPGQGRRKKGITYQKIKMIFTVMLCQY